MNRKHNFEEEIPLTVITPWRSGRPSRAKSVWVDFIRFGSYSGGRLTLRSFARDFNYPIRRLDNLEHYLNRVKDLISSTSIFFYIYFLKFPSELFPGKKTTRDSCLQTRSWEMVNFVSQWQMTTKNKNPDLQFTLQQSN